MIACTTLVAFSSRSVASSRADPAQHSVPRLNIASKNITFFRGQPSFLLPLRRFSGLAPCVHRLTNPE
jgi:hypothetical protein